MKTKTKILFVLFALFAIFALLVFSVRAPVLADAASVAIDEPKTEGITDSTKKRYKDDLFFVGEYRYEAENYTLNYRYHQPADMSEKVPLIIFLHGRGERGSDNDSQLNNAILRPFIENENSKFYDAMVIAPQCPVKEYNNGWVDLFSDDVSANDLAYDNYSVDAIPESTECKAIVALIEDTCAKVNVDKNRVYLIGLSQGAMATWDLLARHSELFAAAVPISGVGDVSKADIYSEIPIYAFHGDADTTVPYEKGTPRIYEAVDALGKNKMNFVTFKGAPHAVWESAIVFQGNGELPALEEWLFAQTKEEKKGGCGAVVGLSAVGVAVPMLAAAVLCLKKKTD